MVKDLLNSDNEFIRDLAKQAVQFRKDFDDKKITASEFQELMDDLLDLKKIDDARFTSEVYCMVVNAVNVLITLKTLAQI